jgi:hypothetical protein
LQLMTEHPHRVVWYNNFFHYVVWYTIFIPLTP